MRRFSWALALTGAIAVAGCGGSTPSQSGNGYNKGVGDSAFTVSVRGSETTNPIWDTLSASTLYVPQGGVVTSNTGGIQCGDSFTACSANFPWGSSVTLTVTPDASTGYYAIAGDAGGSGPGTGTYTLSGNADKGVVVAFSGSAIAHPNFSDAVFHGPAYWAFFNMTQPYLTCTDCHGLNLQGQGLAPSCSNCHTAPTAVLALTAATPPPGHFDPAGALGGHNTGLCSRCHNSDGFRAFIGDNFTVTGINGSVPDGQSHLSQVATFSFNAGMQADGKTPAILGMQCMTCHNPTSDPAAGSLRTHQFPLGNVVTTDPSTAICSQCHDGGRPTYETAQLNKQLTATPLATSPDAQLTATGANKTVRAHYLPAASTLFGAEAANWAQIPGNNYTARNQHGGVASCTFCHDPHDGTLPSDSQVQAKCGSCHFDETTGLPVTTMAALEASRQYGFEGDIDGDGVEEPLNVEIDGLRAQLLAAIQSYATNVVGTAICFDNSASMPNRFYLDDGSSVNGLCGTQVTEYNKYTPRLLRAAYNYMIATNDVGAWAHNPRYAIEVLFDTITDLNAGLTAAGKTPVTFNGKRSFNGHFGAADADSPYAAFVYSATQGAMGFTSGACIECHGGQNGLQTYLGLAPGAMPATANTVAANKVTGMQCATCHALNGQDMKSLVSIATLYFPPGKAAGTAGVGSVAATSLPASFAVCAECHSGRENGATAITGLASGFTNGIKNPHYLGGAAIILGNVAAPMYQYDLKALYGATTTNTYAAQAPFFNVANPTLDYGPHNSPHGARCVGCHDPKQTSHMFEVDLNTTMPQRPDGTAQNSACNGCHNGAHGLKLPDVKTNLDAIAANLLSAMQAYAAKNAVPVPCYNAGGSHGSYFFVTTDNGATCPTTTGYATADSHLAQAGFNYVWYGKEPGAYAHNYDYVAQVLWDGIVDLGGDTSNIIGVTSYDATTGAAITGPLSR